MKEIKFRGRDIETGEYVYAELGRWHQTTNSRPARYVVIDDDAHYIDDVEQFIANDKNCADVYEGDAILIMGYIDDEGEKCYFRQPARVTATMRNLEDIENGLAVKVA